MSGLFADQRGGMPQTRRFGPVAVLAGLLLIGGCGGDSGEQVNEQPRPTLVPASVAEKDTMAADEGAPAAPEADATTTTATAAVQPEPTPAPGSGPDVATETATPSAPTGRYSLQLGSFRKQQNAENLADKIRQLGHEPTIRQVDSGGVTYHRVILPGLADRDQARRLGDELRQSLGVDYLVISNN